MFQSVSACFFKHEHVWFLLSLIWICLNRTLSKCIRMFTVQLHTVTKRPKVILLFTFGEIKSGEATETSLT